MFDHAHNIILGIYQELRLTIKQQIVSTNSDAARAIQREE